MTEETKYENKIFIVSVSFLAPMEGTFQICAKDEAHCREIIAEQFKNREKLNIVSIIDAASIAPVVEAMQETPEKVH